jgi:hypothetical protein
LLPPSAESDIAHPFSLTAPMIHSTSCRQGSLPPLCLHLLLLPLLATVPNSTPFQSCSSNPQSQSSPPSTLALPDIRPIRSPVTPPTFNTYLPHTPTTYLPPRQPQPCPPENPHVPSRMQHSLAMAKLQADRTIQLNRPELCRRP